MWISARRKVTPNRGLKKIDNQFAIAISIDQLHENSVQNGLNIIKISNRCFRLDTVPQLVVAHAHGASVCAAKFARARYRPVVRDAVLRGPVDYCRSDYVWRTDLINNLRSTMAQKSIKTDIWRLNDSRK